jgi:hypothetical protein
VEIGMTDEKWLQVLRQIDKLDRVGLAGVFDRLTTGAKDDSGAFVPGVGMDRANAATLLGLMNLQPLTSRLELMVALEDHQRPDGSSAWDALLAMRPNADNSWRNGGRPENIGWALDDLIAGMKQKEAVA